MSSQLPSLSADNDSRYRILVDAIVDYAVYMLDRNGYVASWNAGARRSKGYEAGEIIGKHFSVFYTPEDRAAGIPETALRTATEEGRFEREGWRLRKDGARFWAHVVIDPIKGAGGEILGFAKITRDLSERKAAEEALRSSEHQFRLLVQSVTDYAIFMLNLQGYVSSWNAGAQRIKGYAPAEIIGKHFSQFYLPEDREAGLPQWGLDVARREGKFEREGWRVRKDGSRFIAHVVIDPIRDESGEIVGFAKITRDVTERKQAQQALEQAQQALFQAQKLESIGQLTGGIAHDFNNLLTAVLASLDLLRKPLANDERATRLLENAIQGAERGAKLTQRMLAFARRQDLEITAVDLGALINGMVNLFERSLGPAISVKTSVVPGQFIVKSDANQLESALLNLAVNSRDAMPQGGEITIIARQTDQHDEIQSLGLKPGRYICISVCDNGLGMDEETLGKAVEPFFTTKGVGKGTGLGLSMIQGLASQSGGAMKLESDLGRGTAVHIWLPAAPIGLQATHSRAESFLKPPSSDARHGVVLVVDDDNLVLTATSAILRELGYTVLEATSGMAALECIANTSNIDLVLTDHAMPGMTGLQLSDALQQLRPGLQVILATGYAELPAGTPPTIRRLSKPYRVDELARAIGAAVPECARC